MLKQLQNILDNDPDLNKYKVLCDDSNQSFIIQVEDYRLDKNLRNYVVTSILNKIIKNDLVITKMLISRDWGSYLIGVFAINVNKALKDDDNTISVEAFFKLKMKEMELK